MTAIIVSVHKAYHKAYAFRFGERKEEREKSEEKNRERTMQELRVRPFFSTREDRVSECKAYAFQIVEREEQRREEKRERGNYARSARAAFSFSLSFFLIFSKAYPGDVRVHVEHMKVVVRRHAVDADIYTHTQKNKR
jgi:hypothetical protein